MAGPPWVESPGEWMARWSIRMACRLLAARRLALRVEGAAHVPAEGPLLLAARHYHHLYDACALLAALDRPLYFFVALDWVDGSPGRRLMEAASRLARWPVVLRTERLERRGVVGRGGSAPRAFASDELIRYVRRGAADAVALLRAGGALVVFPEGYPNVDPTFTPKRGDEFLPFRPGFARLAERAERMLGASVPVVPVGLHYARAGRWQVVVHFGPPMCRRDWPTRERFVAAVEARCRALSIRPPRVAGCATTC